jgi:hypothetical protein
MAFPEIGNAYAIVEICEVFILPCEKHGSKEEVSSNLRMG